MHLAVLAQCEAGHGVRLRGLAAVVRPAAGVGEALVDAVLRCSSIRLIRVLVSLASGPVGVAGNHMTGSPPVGPLRCNISIIDMLIAKLHLTLRRITFLGNVRQSNPVADFFRQIKVQNSLLFVIRQLEEKSVMVNAKLHICTNIKYLHV